MKPKKMPKKDVFTGVPEFLAAFENIQKNGFFQQITFNVGEYGFEGRINGFSLKVIGYVPSDKKFETEGCGVVVDPITLIETCKKLAPKNKIKSIATNVKTNDWAQWDKSENNVVGSKGTVTEMFIIVTLNF